MGGRPHTKSRADDETHRPVLRHPHSLTINNSLTQLEMALISSALCDNYLTPAAALLERPPKTIKRRMVSVHK